MERLNEKDLEIEEAVRLSWVRVVDAVSLLWADNPKLHDLGAVSAAITRYGLRIPPNFDANLPNVSGGQGAIVDGNGRIEALARMEQAGQPLPRGVALDGEGAWCVPLGVGLDAEDKGQAEAFALDANSLVMAGGAFTVFDVAKLWDEGRYAALLERLGQDGALPESVDGDSLDALREWMADEPPEEFPEYGEDIEVEHECPKCGYKWS
jgi:hypothetical protein